MTVTLGCVAVQRSCSPYVSMQQPPSSARPKECAGITWGSPSLSFWTCSSSSATRLVCPCQARHSSVHQHQVPHAPAQRRPQQAPQTVNGITLYVLYSCYHACHPH